jgi:hypothetical protein
VAGGREHDPSVGVANIHSTAHNLERPSNGRLIFFFCTSSLINITEPKVVAVLCDGKHRPADNRDNILASDVTPNNTGSFLCCDALGVLAPPRD